MTDRRAIRQNEMDEKYFREIFHLNAEVHPGHAERRIDFEGLLKIFDMVGFVPNPKQKQEFKDMFISHDPTVDVVTMNFRSFMQIFKLHTNSFDIIDTKNSFRLISKEYEEDGMMKLD